MCHNDYLDNMEPSEALSASLKSNDKRFEIIAKHYYDLFAYHAAQRLTTFNFFIVSLSFFSSAYALLITKSSGGDSYYEVAAALGLVTSVLVMIFSRLDARNEQIIQINEAPLKMLQKTISNHFGAGCWETFRESDRRARFMGTFGVLLPFIYVIAATVNAFGGFYALKLSGVIDRKELIAFTVISCLISSLVAKR